MKVRYGLIAAVLLCWASVAEMDRLDPATATASEDGEWLYYDLAALPIEGKGWADTETPYHRLPAKAKGVVRDAVWSLSTNSAGLCARFYTDADRIGVRWRLGSDVLGMSHMAPTCRSGLDLYVHDEGVWRWIAVGRPAKQENESVLVSGLPEGVHEYLLYLPLYNVLEWAFIGVPPEASLGPAPAREGEAARPIVFYGTSITQGGCAARPGMAYPAILGRWLERDAINLGFSGNGKTEPEMAALLAELDPAIYVLDSLPNLQPDEVTERVGPFVKTLRAAHPDTPIVLVENIRYQAGAFVPAKKDSYEKKNQALQAVYKGLLDDGVTGLTYVPCDDLLGDDGEATVDGTHCTDLGFMRMAEVLAPILRSLLD